MDLRLKKLLAAGASVALILSSATPALAGSEADSSVGDDGNASSYSEDNDNFRVCNHQSGDLLNVDLGVGVSGLNSQSGSDDDNEISSGDADGWGSSANFLNSNMTAIEDSDTDGSAHSDAVVGEDGNATAEAYDNDEVRVSNRNRGELDNFTLGLALSGGNSQDGNDDGNETKTGDSDASAWALNEVNTNWTMIGGSHSAHAFADVADDGNASAYAEDNDEIRVFNYNTAGVLNVSVAAAVSGLNSQSGNDDDNVIDTGESSAESSVANFVNSNVTVVGEGGGSSSADASVGEDGDADSESYDNDSVGVSNSNEAEVTNVSVAAGVSGGNTQDGNDDGNVTTTGSASGGSCSTNTVNSNWTVIGGSMPEGGDSGCN